MRALVMLLLGAALLSQASAAATPATSGPSVLVQIAPLRQGSVPRTVTAYGTVQADSSARVSVVAPVAAVVSELHVRVGEEVAKGAGLVRLAPSPPTTASYTQAVAALAAASASVRQTQQLRDEHLATDQQVAEARKTQSDARAALAALKAQGAGGPAILRAPFRAIVTAVSTSVRAIVTEGTPLIELARPSGLDLVAGVAPAQASAIRAGDRASVTAIGDDRGRPGTVVLRGSVVDSGTGLVPVQIALPPGAFLPGQSAQATITVGTVHGYVVPHEAILVDDDGNPYVVQAVHGVAKIVHVRVLVAQGALDTIDGPLDAKAPLVVSGNYQLENGMRVRLADPGSGG